MLRFRPTRSSMRRRNHIDDGIHAWWLTVGARLQPGVTLAQANASLATVSRPILHAGIKRFQLYCGRRERAFPFRGRTGLPRIHLCPPPLSPATGSDVRDVRRNSAAGVPEPGEPVDGARRGAGTRAGDAAGDRRHAAAADPAAAGGEPVDCESWGQPPGWRLRR